MNLRVLILLSILIMGTVATASSQTVPFRIFSIESGLSESVIHSLVQDERGYIWAATGYGLNRFDGERFKQYYQEQGLADNVVHVLHKDNTGRVWAGTDNGISILQNDSLITPEQFIPLQGKVVLDIYDDRENSIWIATGGEGVWKTDSNGSLVNVTDYHGFRSVHASSITQTDDGIVWIGTNEGLLSYNYQNETLRSFRARDGLPDTRIRDVEAGWDDDLWIAARTGLIHFKDGIFRLYDTTDGLPDNRIQSITATEDEQLWLGTENGASLFNGSEFENFTTENGLPALIVYDILVDRENIVWMGTLGSGLNRYTGNAFHSHTVENGLTNNVVTGFEEDSNGNIWIATYGGGVLIYDGRDMTNFGESDGLADNKVYSIYEDSQNRMWIGTREGINIYENGILTRLNSDLFPFQVIRKIIEVDGDFWIGTYNDGLIHFDGEEYEQYNIQNGLLNNTVMDIKVDEDGTFWIATYGGVAKFDGEMFVHYTIADGLPSNGVIHIYIDHNGDKWFSTFNGIAKLHEDEIIAIPGSSQTETISYFIFQDDEQRYWIGTNRGLYNFKPDQYFEADNRVEIIKSFKLYNQNQGLVTNELNAGGSFVDSDQTVWLGTVEGLSHFYPGRITPNTTPPGIEFEEIMISGESVDDNLDTAFTHDQNFLQITYTGLSLDAPGQILYEYRLRGLEDEWQYSRDRSVQYTSLSPNDYEFQIRAYNSDGVMSEKTASFAFTVLPPFYLSWWFITLLLISILGLLLFFFQYFKVAKQVDIERMRVQIASDLHDDVGSSLTELALQTDFLQADEVNDEVRNTLKQLGEHSRKIVTSLDDIVWSIDSRNDTAGDLTDRMQDYANQVFHHKNVALNFNFDELDMNEKLPVDVKENIYLIFKEAINNVVKHSNANQVDVKFSFEGKTFELLVRDNGSKNSSVRKSGQGLRNIKMRAQRIQADVNIENKDGFVVYTKGSLKQGKL